MNQPDNPFKPYTGKPKTTDGVFSQAEVALSNRNSGLLLETLALDITPTGAHYLLNHFDVPLLDADKHRLQFTGAFDSPYTLTMKQIKSLPQVTMPVTMECAGNGRAGVSPRSFSMPWMYEAVGTSMWTGTPLAPLIEKANPQEGVLEISFMGADYGFDKGEGHYFGRSLTLQQIEELDVLLVHSMNELPLLPQHGAPLRIIVPGWYGMASVKWLNKIEALTQPFNGFQQVRTYRYRKDENDPGRPITTIRVKSLMQPPGVPDWSSRKRFVNVGPAELTGRAWSGAGVAIEKVEVSINGDWYNAELGKSDSPYAWVEWHYNWQAQAGEYTLRCRATDANGNIQPLDPPWDMSGFANNAAQSVHVFVA